MTKNSEKTSQSFKAVRENSADPTAVKAAPVGFEPSRESLSALTEPDKLCLQAERRLAQLERDFSRFGFALKELKEIL